MSKVKDICLVLLGMALAVGLFCLIVAIGCGVNGISFGAQISQWFGSTTPSVKEPVEEVVKAVSQLHI